VIGPRGWSWEQLTSFVESAITEDNEGRINTALEWLEKADKLKKQWAYRFTWAYCGAGQNTTGVSCPRPAPATALPRAR
jgi:hypothetical protein